MCYDDFIKLLLSGGSIALGAFLTAVRNRISSTKKKNNLHYYFYAFSGLVIISSLGAAYFYWNKLIEPSWFGISIILASLGAAVLLLWFTSKYLISQRYYETKKLDPIINDFTCNADKNNIKLLAGDISFFGNNPQEMDRNLQYNCLKQEGFRQIQILCFEPKNNSEKIRYGKILHDFPDVEIKFYCPPNADLNVRGRMKTLNNVTHLLIYNKISPGIYEALETDTANSNGALYEHIWNLIWSLADAPTQERVAEYEYLFRH